MPLTGTDPIGEEHTVIATVESDAPQPIEVATRAPLPGVLVTFEITAGPNDGLTSANDGECSPVNCETDENGQVSWTYSSNILGSDTIIASFEDPDFGTINSNAVQETWVQPPRDIPTLSEWGLIAMAGILGIVGFIVMRRRQAVV